MDYSLGEKLREASESRNITLLEASRDTRISRKYIQALESGEFDVFPAGIYLTNFLRAYAEYLNLDAESILRNDGVRKYFSEPHSYKVFASGMVARKGKKGFFIILIIPVCLACLALAVSSLSHRRTGHSEQVMPVEAKIVTDKDTKDLAVTVLAKLDTWVRADCDGKVSFEGIVHPDEKRTWDARENIRVRIGNVYGVELYQGEKKIDIIKGQRGSVNEFVFTNERGGESVVKKQKQALIDTANKTVLPPAKPAAAVRPDGTWE